MSEAVKLPQDLFIVDSHCHLDLVEKKGISVDEVIKNASDASVKLMLTVCTKIDNFPEVIKYADKYECVFASVGLHPNDTENHRKVSYPEIIKICSDNKKVIGIGETGLDYYYTSSDKKSQTQSLQNHIIASQETGLATIIHCRSSDDDMIEILTSEQKNKQFPAVLHCFTGTKKLAKAALDLGMAISISGIVTFKNALELQEIVRYLPLDSMLVETDSPYLAPIPNRGKTNQPSYTRHVAEFISEIKCVSLEEVSSTTTNNFFNTFCSTKSYGQKFINPESA